MHGNWTCKRPQRPNGRCNENRITIQFYLIDHLNEKWNCQLVHVQPNSSPNLWKEITDVLNWPKEFIGFLPHVVQFISKHKTFTVWSAITFRISWTSLWNETPNTFWEYVGCCHMPPLLYTSDLRIHQAQ